MNILLVTGARSLATREGAEAWARGLIAKALADAALLIVGDASGPDEWACAEAVRRRGALCASPLTLRYVTRGRAAGWIVREGGMRSRAWTDDVPPMRGDPAEMTRAWYLLRNTAMVEDCKRLADRDNPVTCLALLDGLKVDAPGKRASRGTEHTAGLAEGAGLTVRREVWRG